MSSRFAARRTADYNLSRTEVLKNMRLKLEWKRALSENRLLILSIFAGKFRRSTVELARQRNKFVAALADKSLLPTPRKGVER